jgi:enterochelin esterase family protein
MNEKVQHEKYKLARRSLLRRAAMLGGGAALAKTFPSLAAKAADVPVAGGAPGQKDVVVAAAESTVRKAAFSTDFLANPVFRDLALNFDPPNPARVDGALLQTGALVQPSGDILFRIHAPQAQGVTLKFDLVRTGELVLAKQDNGIFEALLPYDDSHTGPMTVDVHVDGMIFLYPYMPIHWSASRPHNFIEVPDAEMEFMFIKDVPHGAMSREIYWADAIRSWERCIIYTPPGYMKSNKKYPVLYLQHGGGENEVVWGYCGRVAYILDNLIAAGKAEPFIVVMNNGMLRYPDNTGSIIDDAFERMLTQSCLPHIEKNYRVRTGKWNRALAGLSMGSMMSCDIAFRHPELFGNLGTFTASMTHETFATSYERPYPAVMKDPTKFTRNYRVYFRSTTPQEDHYSDYFIADDKLCADAGIDKYPGYHRIVYAARTTKWNSWRLGLRDYAQLLFR